MDIKLDNDMLTTVVSGAILNAITKEQRDVLIQGALKSLMTKPEGSGYSYDKRTPLQRAFDHGVQETR